MITSAQFLDWTGRKSSSPEAVAQVVLAVNAYVSSLPGIDLNEDGTWAETTVLGAILLASRLYKRRESANGIDAITDAGPTYVSRYDSDIARLLHIDGFDKPQVG